MSVCRAPHFKRTTHILLLKYLVRQLHQRTGNHQRVPLLLLLLLLLTMGAAVVFG